MTFITALYRLAADLYRNRRELIIFLIMTSICLVVFIVSLKVFLELAESVLEKEMTWFDDQAGAYLIKHRSDSLTPFIRAVTHLGDKQAFGIIIVLTAGLLYWRKKSWTYSAQVAVVLFTAGFVNKALKNFFEVQRPDKLLHLVEATSPSFPSGHAMGSMAFYGFLIYLCWHLMPSVKLRFFLTFLLGSLILLIGLSRIYLGVHYASDVLAGFAGGLLWLSLCILIFRVVRFIGRKRQPWASHARHRGVMR